MAKKEFSKFFIAALKRTAQNVYPLVRRKNKIKEEMESLQNELDEIQTQIDGYQYPIAQETGGYTTEDLVVRTVVDSGKLDKDGKPIKVTQYTLAYPDTVVPPEEPQQQPQGSDNDIDVYDGTLKVPQEVFPN